MRERGDRWGRAGKGGRKNWEELSPWRGLAVAVAESGRERAD